MENKENEVKNGIVSSNSRNEIKRGSEFSLSRKVSFIRESVSDGDSGALRRRSGPAAADSRSQDGGQRDAADHSSHRQDENSMKVPRKFAATWRQACDRTKDKTKELLKRWKTLPEGNTEMQAQISPDRTSPSGHTHNWSVHVWASYIKRYPSEEENLLSSDKDKEPVFPSYTLSPTQTEKLGHFYIHLIDTDHDDLISEQDFQHFSERLRRFADWSTNSPEFLIMSQVQHGFTSTFLALDPSSNKDRTQESERWKQYIGLEEWLQGWSLLFTGARNLQDFPLWLQYLPKLFFQAINRSGSGTISRDELGSFYSSMLSFTPQRTGEILDEAYKALTSNGDHPISYQVYRLAFTNFLLGRHPNGPGQYLLGCVTKISTFPIDYSALNCQPEDREHYSPDRRSNRVSVVV